MQPKKNLRYQFLLANLLGYGYIFLVLGIIIGLAVAIVCLMAYSHSGYAAGKLVIILAILAGLILKSLWIDIKPPQGRDLLRIEAPRLYQMIEDLRKELKVSRIHKIKLTAELNAWIVQHPMLGIFGYYKNYLGIGLPLLETLNVEQFKAILAHEMCHISKKHGRSSLWANRMLNVWTKLSETFEGQKTWMNLVFRIFFKKFIPYYRTLSQAFKRQHEYESDAYSADAISGSDAVKALLRLEIMSASSDKYWEKFDKSVQTQNFPPEGVYVGYINHMRQSFALENVEEIVSNAMLRQTLDLDTHPCLLDRLRNLGFNYSDGKIVDDKQSVVHFKEDVQQTAAEFLLDKNLLSQWHKEIALSWDEDNKKHWYQLRERYHKNEKRLKELIEKASTEAGLTKEEFWEKAQIHDDFSQEAEAEADFRKLIEMNHQTGSAKLLLGKILLKRNDPSGTDFIEQGLALEPQFGVWASNRLIEFYEKRGEKDKVAHWYQKALKSSEADRLSDIERKQVLTTDTFIPHQIDEKLIEQFKNQISPIAEVKRAYLMCKKLEHYAHLPVYLLVFQIKDKLFAKQDYYKQFEQYFLRQIWPVEVFITVQNGEFINKAKKVSNSLIYGKK